MPSRFRVSNAVAIDGAVQRIAGSTLNFALPVFWVSPLSFCSRSPASRVTCSAAAERPPIASSRFFTSPESSRENSPPRNFCALLANEVRYA
ncbi:MAG: hypothetical protein QM723_12010 [Myxococcaceae bacterium]